jgi:2'-5' RNA ligase
MPERQRLFFALWPEPALQDCISRAALDAAAKAGVRGKPVPPARCHLTLLFLGELDPEMTSRAQAAAATVTAAPFELRLDRLGHFNASKVLWAGGGKPPQELMQLWDCLRAAMAQAGVPHERTRITPHVTCLRQASGPASLPMAPQLWPVREFALVHSVLAGTPEYRVITRWPLNGRAAAAPVKTGQRSQLPE